MHLLHRSADLQLPETPLFAACRAGERRSLSRLGTTITVPAGSTLTPEGRPGKEFFVVKGGTATCSSRGSELARFAPGDFFGEMALLDGGPRTATVTADSSMELVVYGSVEFRTMLDTSTTVARRLLTELARRLRVADTAA